MKYQIDVSGVGVIITGASKGIGQALAHGFSECGARVINADLRPPEPPHDEVLLQNIEYIETDITNFGDVQKMVEKAAIKHPINVLINNAGVIYKALAEQMDMAQWDHVLKVNLTGPMNCAKAVIPHLKKQQSSRIINLCSMQSFLGTPTYGAYTATKSALSGLTRVWAKELAEFGVTVNGICPSFVDTPMLKNAIQKFADEHDISFDDAYKTFIEPVPQKRVLQPEEIVFLSLFLSSPLAQSITGQNILATGGMVLS
ncbi:MAG: SDR family oxidoreductase [Desulfobulbaceae bacterium]|nr:SDR family oxidoreductase [Desulfobulbaceae bacterium]